MIVVIFQNSKLSLILLAYSDKGFCIPGYPQILTHDPPTSTPSAEIPSLCHHPQLIYVFILLFPLINQCLQTPTSCP